jgi:ribose transport system permease protein
MARQPRSYVRPVEVVVPYVLVGIALVAGALAAPGFLSSNHLSSMGQTAGYVGIIAIGETLVLLLGGIDLSVPYTINLSAILLAGFQADGLSPTHDVLLVLLVGLGVGLVNGLGVALLDINPLVMTLGMNSILQGVSLIYSNGSPIGQAPAFVTTVSTGWWHNTLPWVDVLWAALTVCITLTLVFTTFGRSIYAVGSNRRASELGGMPVRRTIVLAYVLSSLAATVGGILLVGYSGQAFLGMGDEYLLPAIAVVVIGGTSIFGGKGSYVQTVAGALLITVIESILVTVNVDQSGQDIMYGAIILVMAYGGQLAVSGSGLRLGTLGGRLGPLRGWLQPVPTREEVAAAPPDLTEQAGDSG